LQGSWYQAKTYHGSYSTAKRDYQTKEANDCQDGNGLPNSFWVEAVKTIVYILKRTVANAMDGKTPQEAYYGKKPLVVHFTVFGFECYMHVQNEVCTKLERRVKNASFWVVTWTWRQIGSTTLRQGMCS